MAATAAPLNVKLKNYTYIRREQYQKKHYRDYAKQVFRG
jgi:hypothetical protein